MPTLTRAGFQLNGWFTQPIGGTQVREGDIVTGAMALAAQWIAIPSAPESTSIPVTGSDLGPWPFLGIGLLLLGLVR